MELHNPDGGGESAWGDLPPELVERSLACLPSQCLARCRTVCKRWNALLSSKYFINLWAEYCGTHPPWLVVCTPGTAISCPAFCFLTNTWHAVSLGFLPGKYVVECKGSAGGLLLLSIPSSSCFAFPMLCVCNPLRRSWISLPEMPSIRSIIASGITQPRGDFSYRVVVVGKTRNGATVVETYESSTATWRPAVRLGDADLSVRKGEMLFHDGCFFCVTAKPQGVVAYNLEGGVWKALPLPLPLPLHADEHVHVRHRLVVCGGRLGMVGGVERDHALRDLIIWELRGEGWHHIHSMPPPLLEGFCRTSCSKWFECSGVGRYLCFRAHGSLQVVVYDTVRGSWGCLPRCPLPLDDRKSLLLKSVAYQPTPNLLP